MTHETQAETPTALEVIAQAQACSAETFAAADRTARDTPHNGRLAESSGETGRVGVIRNVSTCAQLLALCIAMQGCSATPTTKPLTQPDRVNGSLPQPTSAPATSDEWARLTRELDDARAINARKDAQLAAAMKAQEAANFATWKRFGNYSYALTAIGMILLVLAVLPWTAAMFGGTRSVALLLVGGGILFGALPHILETYGPIAFYPLAIITAGYIGTLAALDIMRRIRNARAEAHVCVAAMDERQPDVGIAEVIDVRMANNPAFAAAMEKAQP